MWKNKTHLVCLPLLYYRYCTCPLHFPKWRSKARRLGVGGKVCLIIPSWCGRQLGGIINNVVYIHKGRKQERKGNSWEPLIEKGSWRGRASWWLPLPHDIWNKEQRTSSHVKASFTPDKAYGLYWHVTNQSSWLALTMYSFFSDWHAAWHYKIRYSRDLSGEQNWMYSKTETLFH